MAERDADEVAQILSRGYQQVIANRQFQQEQAERQREALANEQARKDELAQRQSQFNAQQAAAEKLFKLQQAGQEFNQAMQSVPLGVTPPGFVQVPGTGAQPTPGQPLVSSELQNRRLIGPSGQVVEVPTPQMYSAQQEAQQAALLRPQQAAQVQMEGLRASQQADEQRRQEVYQQARDKQQHLDYLEIMGKQEVFLKQQAAEQRAFLRAQQEDKNALQLQLYGLKQQVKASSIWGSTTGLDEDGNVVITPNDPTQRIQQGVNDIRDGKMTLETAKKEFPGQQFASLDQAVKNRGYNYLTQKDQDGIRELETLSALVPNMYKLFKLRLDNKAMTAAPNWLGGSADEYNSLRDQVNGQVAGAATTLNQIKRFNSKEVSYMQNALTPSLDIFTHNGKAEFDKYLQFTKDLQDLLSNKLSNLSDKQKNYISQNLGYNNFPYLGSLNNAPGTPVNAIPGATPHSMQQGGQQVGPRSGQIFVHVKGKDFSPANVGWMSREQFNPNKYEYAKPPGAQ